jgi:hypothetical protein
MRTIEIFSILFLSFILQMCVAHSAEPTLEIVGTAVPDGTNWTLGDGGIGRPFSVRIVLGNRSKTPVRIWRPDSPDGSHLAWVTLSDSEGHETKLEWPAIPRFGLPSSLSVEPNGTAVYNLELLRAQGITDLKPGTYRLVAHYANTTAADGQSQGVWTGEIASQPLVIKIQRP